MEYYWKHGLCLGSKYRCCPDPPKPKVISTLNFPTFRDILNVKWVDMKSRFHPVVSKIYIKLRLLMEYNSLYDSNTPSTTTSSTTRESVANNLASLVSDMFSTNDYSDKVDLLSEQDISELTDVLHRRILGYHTTCPVLVYSVSGSCLSQEVTKILSLVGEPMKNVFLYDGKTFEGKTITVGCVNAVKQTNADSKIDEALLLDDDENVSRKKQKTTSSVDDSAIVLL